MSASTWLGLAGFVFILGFIVFAFRQGTSVPPSGRDHSAGDATGGSTGVGTIVGSGDGSTGGESSE